MFRVICIEWEMMRPVYVVQCAYMHGWAAAATYCVYLLCVCVCGCSEWQCASCTTKCENWLNVRCPCLDVDYTSNSQYQHISHAICNSWAGKLIACVWCFWLRVREGARTGVINDMHPNIIFANIWNRLQLPLHSLIIFTLQISLHKRNYEKQYVCVCALLRSRTCAVSIWCAFYQATTDNATTATITSINSNDKKLNKNK